MRAKLVQETVSTVKISTTDIQQTIITDKISDNVSNASSFIRSNPPSIKPEFDPEYLAWLANEEAELKQASTILSQKLEEKKEAKKLAMQQNIDSKKKKSSHMYESNVSDKICSTYKSRKHDTTPYEISFQSNVSENKLTVDLTKDNIEPGVSPWKLEFAAQCSEIKYSFSFNEIPIDMKKKPGYKHILNDKLETISTTVCNLACDKYWDCHQDITTFITTLIHSNSLWDLGFHNELRTKTHKNNNYYSQCSYTTTCFCPCSNSMKSWRERHGPQEMFKSRNTHNCGKAKFNSPTSLLQHCNSHLDCYMHWSIVQILDRMYPITLY